MLVLVLVPVPAPRASSEHEEYSVGPPVLPACFASSGVRSSACSVSCASIVALLAPRFANASSFFELYSQMLFLPKDALDAATCETALKKKSALEIYLKPESCLLDIRNELLFAISLRNNDRFEIDISIFQEVRLTCLSIRLIRTFNYLLVYSHELS